MHLWSNLQENVGDSLKKGNKCPHETCDKQAQGIHGSRDNAETRTSLPLVIFFPTQNPISLQVVRVPFYLSTSFCHLQLMGCLPTSSAFQALKACNLCGIAYNRLKDSQYGEGGVFGLKDLYLLVGLV
jgi:hypothetical protein